MGSRVAGATWLALALACAWTSPRPVTAVKFVVEWQTQECVSQTIGGTVSKDALPETIRIESRIIVADDTAVGPKHVKKFANMHRKVTATLTGPSGQVLWSNYKVHSQARLDVFDNNGPGTYNLCIFAHSEKWRHSVPVDIVYFTLMHHSPEEESAKLEAAGVTEGTPEDRTVGSRAQEEHVTQLRLSMQRTADLLTVIRGEQKYFKRRVGRHMLTTEETHWRAVFYPLMEVGFVGCVTLAQVVVIHRLFRKRSRYSGFQGV